jgi:glycosyltransferase involved in cell wall biosynthesis
MNSRVGWVTTWNVKCGIASHVGHLLSAIPSDEVVVFAARQEPTLRPDQANCVRSWTPGKEDNGLDEIARQLDAQDVSALVIHYNYGFFNHQELSDFIDLVTAKNIPILIDLHSTVDPSDKQNFRLADFVSALRKCGRVLAHGPADMARLKALGVTDNVMLFPLGVVSHRRGAPLERRDAAPLIASFGFSFGNKGLVQLVEAVAILRDAGHRLRVRMLNAEFPIPESAEVVHAVRESIDRFGLQDDIDFRSDYLEEDICLALLSEADLVVNPYQQTGESASAAVRYGMTTGRPVAVTPLPIFDDLGDAVFRMPGTNPSQIAAGIKEALQQISAGSDKARAVRQSAAQWLDAHDVSRQGARLMRTARALARQRLSPAML